MTIPVSSGQIAASQIRTEFGASGGGTQVSLGNYRVSFTNTSEGGTLSNLPLDEGIPQGNSPIAMSDFYSKSLNIVVDVHTGGDEFGVNAKQKYNSTSPVRHTVIGGFKNKQQSGSRIIINVNKKLGSVASPTANTSATKCALRTGTWGSGSNAAANVEVRFGNSAKLFGSGGKGGNGKSDNNGSAQSGGSGGSGLGIQQSGTKLFLSSSTVIRRGYGGGGGGGHATETSKNTRQAGGGGGGGGSGFPGGPKGNGGSPNGGAGNSGGLGNAGNGGTGFNNDNEARGGNGGRGAKLGQTAQAGNSGNGEGEGESEGGAAGGNGKGIRTSVGNSFSFQTGNTGTVDDKSSPGNSVT